MKKKKLISKKDGGGKKNYKLIITMIISLSRGTCLRDLAVIVMKTEKTTELLQNALKPANAKEKVGTDQARKRSRPHILVCVN